MPPYLPTRVYTTLYTLGIPTTLTTRVHEQQRGAYVCVQREEALGSNLGLIRKREAFAQRPSLFLLGLL